MYSEDDTDTEIEISELKHRVTILENKIKTQMLTPNEVFAGVKSISELSKDNQIFKTFFEQFNLKVSMLSYHYSTEFFNDDRPPASLIFMISDIKMPYNIAKKICTKYKRVGWQARPYNGYCAHGPFDAILLYPKNNPQMFGSVIFGEDKWKEISTRIIDGKITKIA